MPSGWGPSCTHLKFDSRDGALGFEFPHLTGTQHREALFIYYFIFCYDGIHIKL
jgi:hypothetical protein